MALIDRPLEEQFDRMEAAKRLGISVKYLMKHVREGRIRYINVALAGAKRQRLRFTPYMLKQFQAKQQHREIAPCPFTSKKTPHTTATISSSTVVAFSALQKPETKKMLFASKGK